MDVLIVILIPQFVDNTSGSYNYAKHEEIRSVSHALHGRGFIRPCRTCRLNYAGQVAVNGQPFDGQGLFKFALVNADGRHLLEQ